MKYDWQEIHMLRTGSSPVPWSEIAAGYSVKPATVRGAYSRWLRAERGEEAPDYSTPTPAYVHGEHITLVSRPDNTFLLGVAGDRHHGSKYHRQDVLEDLYSRFDAAGVDAILDTGNWIDGEARFNRHDLEVHGLRNQILRMAEETPFFGVPTLAVWGDDHEGWYAKREGIDVGEYAETIMRREGHDWTNLGYMESHVVLKNANSGAETVMVVMHPGGGSAYALSYRPQKIVESMEGGEKPAVIIMGHYHKLEALNVRNVWVLQSGCCMDQSPFMRKKSIEAHVGGAILGMEQDPDTGAIIGFDPSLKRYFNRGFYQGRWSQAGKVTRAKRTLVPVSPHHEAS